MSSPNSETASLAKDEAADLGRSATDAGRQVAGTAKTEASRVASEATDQLRSLWGETQSQLKEQASAQQERAASGLHSLSGELDGMASSSEGNGMAHNLVRDVAARAEKTASWLEQRDPGSLLEEVRGFARRRPGTFIALAAVAGIAAGRLTRSLASADDSDQTDSPSGVGAQEHAPRDTGVVTTPPDTGLATGRPVPPVTPPVPAPMPLYDSVEPRP